MPCLICQKNDNLYGDPIDGFKVGMHQTHSETVGDTTTHYHSVDSVQPVRFQICRDCLSKKVRKDLSVFILLSIFCAILSIIGIFAAPFIGGGLSLVVLCIGGLGLFFLMPPLVKRLIVGTKKRNSFYIWELASEKGISSPGFIMEIQTTKKIDRSNDRELVNSKAGNFAIKYIIPGIVVIIFIWFYTFWAASVPKISKAKPIDNSGNTICLYVQKNLTLVSFDGKKIKRSAGFGAKAAAVNVPEGEHTLVFDYSSSNGDTTTTAKGFEFATTFETGGFYLVNYKLLEDKKIRLYLRPTKEGVYLDPDK
jgi:hypothetical protein